jgi:hypothetical protein
MTGYHCDFRRFVPIPIHFWKTYNFVPFLNWSEGIVLSANDSSSNSRNMQNSSPYDSYITTANAGIHTYASVAHERSFRILDHRVKLPQSLYNSNSILQGKFSLKFQLKVIQALSKT